MKVYAAINAVQRELASVGIAKAQQNHHDRYQFRGIDDVYNALAPALARHGLVILPRVTEREVTERSSRSGGAMFYVVLRIEFDFVAAEDGSTHTVVAFGEAMDRSDKATNKAMSAAYKYAAFQTFCIPTEGAPDADADTPEVSPTAPTVVSTDQAARLKAALKATGADVAAFCAHFQVPSVDQLGATQFDLASRLLARKQSRVASAADLNDAL